MWLVAVDLDGKREVYEFKTRKDAMEFIDDIKEVTNIKWSMAKGK